MNSGSKLSKNNGVATGPQRFWSRPGNLQDQVISITGLGFLPTSTVHRLVLSWAKRMSHSRAYSMILIILCIKLGSVQASQSAVSAISVAYDDKIAYRLFPKKWLESKSIRMVEVLCKQARTTLKHSLINRPTETIPDNVPHRANVWGMGNTYFMCRFDEIVSIRERGKILVKICTSLQKRSKDSVYEIGVAHTKGKFKTGADEPNSGIYCVHYQLIDSPSKKERKRNYAGDVERMLIQEWWSDKVRARTAKELRNILMTILSCEERIETQLNLSADIIIIDMENCQRFQMAKFIKRNTGYKSNPKVDALVGVWEQLEPKFTDIDIARRLKTKIEDLVNVVSGKCDEADVPKGASAALILD